MPDEQHRFEEALSEELGHDVLAAIQRYEGMTGASVLTLVCLRQPNGAFRLSVDAEQPPVV